MTRETSTGTTDEYRQFLERLARDRGYRDAEELAEHAAAAYPRFDAQTILTGSDAGFGRAVRALVELTPEEEWELSEAWGRMSGLIER
jgi:hypothetical protein